MFLPVRNYELPSITLFSQAYNKRPLNIAVSSTRLKKNLVLKECLHIDLYYPKMLNTESNLNLLTIESNIPRDIRLLHFAFTGIKQTLHAIVISITHSVSRPISAPKLRCMITATTA